MMKTEAQYIHEVQKYDTQCKWIEENTSLPLTELEKKSEHKIEWYATRKHYDFISTFSLFYFIFEFSEATQLSKRWTFVCCGGRWDEHNIHVWLEFRIFTTNIKCECGVCTMMKI